MARRRGPAAQRERDHRGDPAPLFRERLTFEDGRYREGSLPGDGERGDHPASRFWAFSLSL